MHDGSDSLDNVSDVQVEFVTTPRRLRDIALHCQDGIIMVASQVLAMNSVVFEKMLFSTVQMEESITSIVRLDDVKMADMEIMIQFCTFHKNYMTIVNSLTKESTLSAIAVAHQFEFHEALEFLCRQLLKVIPQPSPAELQFADRRDLQIVLSKWSRLCLLPHFQQQFIVGLVDFPLSIETLKLFAAVNYTDQMIPKCMCAVVFYGAHVYILRYTLTFLLYLIQIYMFA